MTEPLRCQREAFAIPPDAHYFDCAYMGPLPRVSEEAGIEAIRRKRLPSSTLPPEAFWESDRLRELFAELIHSDEPGRVAIQPGISYGIATAAHNLPVRSTQNIVVTHEQFPSAYYSWKRIADESGAQLRIVYPPEGLPRGAGWNERLLEAIDAGTAVVCVPNVHWTDGTLFDLVEVGRRCRSVGAALIIDAIQSLGALDLDVRSVQPDALLCATYKWLLGPYSLSLAYFGDRFDDGTPIEETWLAREGSRDFQHLADYTDAYAPGAVRYDMSERANFFLAPIAQRSLELILDWTPVRIQEYCHLLTGDLFEEARSMGFAVEDEGYRASHLFGLGMPKGVDLVALRDSLSQRNVYASLRGDVLRLSANVYNDDRDVEVLSEVLRDAVRQGL